MGGNAFPHLNLVRVKREDVLPTVKFVVDTLKVEGFTYEYAKAHLMGSAGKQADSGDLDFAMNNRRAALVGEPVLPVFSLRDVAARARAVLPEGHVVTKTLRGGQFQTAFPVSGDHTRGYVQVDFVSGYPRWLMFSHFSPGLDVSPFKGVAVSTLMGVLAKLRKDFEAYSDGSFAVGENSRGFYLNGPSEVERVARVGLHYDLEKGLYRKWQLQDRPGHGMRDVGADAFETHVPQSPRFTRVGYVTEPEAVLDMLFGTEVAVHEVNTFEKMVAMVRRTMPHRFEEAAERFTEAFQRSSGAGGNHHDTALLDAVWK